jgi:hypothetical protein
MVDDAARRDLFEARATSLGPATTLMELLPPVGRADVARRSDLVAIGGEMAEIRGEMAELKAELRGDMATLRTELKDEIGALRSRLDGQLATIVRTDIRLAFGTAGLVLAAAKLI